MVFWVLIAAFIFVLVIAVENHLKAKRARDKKMKAISDRIKAIEQRDEARQRDQDQQGEGD